MGHDMKPITGLMLLLLVSIQCSCQRPLKQSSIEVREQPVADVIVVLGKRPPVDSRGRVIPELANRLDRGIELFEHGYAPRLLMTGGPSPAGIEARYMKTYAARRGVPVSALITEERSTSTIENARFTRALLCGSGSCKKRVIVVSNPYHVRRGARLFRCAGFDVIPVAASPSAWDDENRRYEAAAWLYYLFIDECTQAMPR